MQKNFHIPCGSRILCNFLCPITQELHSDQPLWAGVLNLWFLGRVSDRVRL